MNRFGNFIRSRREEQNLLLRQVAQTLEMDAPMLSKIERGVRNLKREKLAKLSGLLSVPEKQLVTLWLASKVYETLQDEEMAYDALKVAEEEIIYHSRPKLKRP